MPLDFAAMIAGPGTMLAALALLTFAALRAWRDWLALRRLEIEMVPPPAATARWPLPAPPAPAQVRIEVADLRERIRKLEAIAAGIDP